MSSSPSFTNAQGQPCLFSCSMSWESPCSSVIAEVLLMVFDPHLEQGVGDGFGAVLRGRERPIQGVLAVLDERAVRGSYRLCLVTLQFVEVVMHFLPAVQGVVADVEQACQLLRLVAAVERPVQV